MMNSVIERNRDFGRAVEREMGREEARGMGMRIIIRRAIERGAPRFYVSYETACRMMACGGRKIEHVDSFGRRRQWYDFGRLVRAHMQERGMTQDRAILVTLAIDKAPSFYLSVRQGMAIWNEYRRQRALEKGGMRA